MGNPCAEWSGYRPYVIAKLPQLKKLVREWARVRLHACAKESRKVGRSHE